MSSNSRSLSEVGLTGGYDGDSLALKVIIAFFPGLAMYNVVELLILILGSFNRFRGLYFWSLIVASVGIIPYSLGFTFKFFSILTGSGRWVPIFLLTLGWYPMITGQSVVLWSRLHLVVTGQRGHKILHWTKWMIIINAIVLHIPTTVLTIGSNGNNNTQVFARGYNVMEKVQMCGFFVQEVILSSIYIIETVRILRYSIQGTTRRLMYQLIGINVLIIIMDLGILALECASLYILQITIKAAFYSIKLKLEFAILSRLVQYVGGPRQGTRQIPVSMSDMEAQSQSTAGGQQNRGAEYVTWNEVETDRSRTSQLVKTSSLSRQIVRQVDIEIEELEHGESTPPRTWASSANFPEARPTNPSSWERSSKKV
ncbi:hypothetical protein LTR84_010807 [Exophiala bonariae]|uniref:DUF7703 domain-containing protein n=1 Tax=Exophiala bonariae TaxID=1690606 RepID=A0AAV9NLT3_9EURO|nr:hypothetical protein LTR84_010807 [Exophiala bonariae]